MPRLLLATCLLLPLSALSGCGEEAPTAESLPSGVAEQHSVLADEVDERGGRTRSGDWTVSFIVEAAEPRYAARNGRMEFEKPSAAETHHIEIIPTETATGRIVPDTPVKLQVLDAEGAVVDEESLHFLHSTFFHYANNFEVPKEGTYTLRATIGAPTFLRHGEEGEEPALAEGTVVEFEGVELARE